MGTRRSVTGPPGPPGPPGPWTSRHVDIIDLFAIEKEVEIVVVDKNKTSADGAFFPYLNNTVCNVDAYGVLETVGKIIMNIILCI